MREEDAEQLIAAEAGATVVTWRRRRSVDLIARLAAAGIDRQPRPCRGERRGGRAAFAAGARAVDALFNAMSQLGIAPPGLLGAALADPTSFAA